MNWFLLSILSVFALAYSELTQQKLLNGKDSFSARTSGVFTLLFQAILALIVISIFGNPSQLSAIFEPNIFLRMIIVSVIGAFGIVFYFKSFQVKNISLSTILVSCSMIVSTILGIIFFSESATPIKFLGIFLILVSIIMVNYSNVLFEKNHIYGLIAGVSFGITYTIDKTIVLDTSPLIYLVWVFVFGSVTMFLLNPKDVINSVKTKALIDFKPILFSCVGYFTYNLFTFSAYEMGGEVGRIDAINNAQIFLIIFFEYFVLKHTQGLIRKIMSALIAFSGMVLLGFF